ncbi:hypothetical protein AB0M38_36070 [Streptomyces sp. NPDC051742]|uniref:hypothetical protein n=1 Tax=unclassified Streptomyces TaxID=2593676 RepID=UPI00343F6677
MEKIEFADVVQAYLRTVPHAGEVLRDVPEPQRSSFEAWPEEETDLFDFLPMAFMRPVLLPALREETPDPELLGHCFDFVEGLARNSNAYLQNALHFEVYEQFLESREILLRARRFCGPVSGAALLQMLRENYPATLEKLTGESEPDRP